MLTGASAAGRVELLGRPPQVEGGHMYETGENTLDKSRANTGLHSHLHCSRRVRKYVC